MSRFEQLLEYLRVLQLNYSENYENIVLIKKEIDKELGLINE